MMENSSTSTKGLLSTGWVKLLLESYDRLPEREKRFWNYGPVYFGGNAAFAGLIANSLYRRALNVTYGRLASSLPMAVLPFLTTYAFYNSVVSNPLLSGDLNCPSCAMMRGALVGVCAGGLYPILLALPVNIALASRYDSAPMPEKGNTIRFFIDLSRPVLNKMRAVFLLQALFGTYLSWRHFKTYEQMVKDISEAEQQAA